MSILLILLVFGLGAVAGSFLNVVAFRSIQGGSIFLDRSHCPFCHKKLGVLDLIPLVSFVFLQGKCRYCGKKISWRYPVFEIASGLLFVLSYLAALEFSVGLLFFLQLVFLLLISGVFLVLFITDLFDGLLPNPIVVFGIITIFLLKLLLVSVGALAFSDLIFSVLVAFMVAGSFFGIVVLSSEKALGGGDVKLLFLIGISLSWTGFLLSLFVGFLTGAIVAVMLILLGKKTLKQTLPLGPFLVFGAFVALFWGKEIIDLYLNLSA